MTNLRKARLLQGWNQSEAAKLLDISERTLRSYENGAPVPSTIIVKLAELTGRTADYLLGLTTKEENK